VAPDRRFPQRLYRSGREPDPRFTLANERTFLAWIRTSIALLAAGVALEALKLPIQPGLRLATSLLLIGAGIGAPLQAWFGWLRTEGAMRASRPLPSPRLAGPLAAVVFSSGILIVLGLLLWR
jgi:putative membrane protein